MGNLAMRALDQGGNVWRVSHGFWEWGNGQGLGVQHGLVNHTFYSLRGIRCKV